MRRGPVEWQENNFKRLNVGYTLFRSFADIGAWWIVAVSYEAGTGAWVYF